MATPVIMPKFGMAQEDATVIAWLYREGDRVERGAPILEVETDKTTMVVEAPATGVLRGLSAHPGDLVPVTQVIAYILEPGEALPAAEPPAPASEKPDRPPRLTPVARRMAAHEGLDLDRLEIPSGKRVISRRDIEQAIASREQMSPEGNSGAGRIRATPAARRLARAHGVDLADVPGRGPRGRVQAGDVLQAASPGPAGHAPPASRIEPLTGKRRTIAARMTRSYQEAPHITLTVEADMAAALEIIRAPGGQEGPTVTPVSVTAFLVKACAWVLTRHPRLNASFREDGIHLFSHVNIGVAVALDDGLIVPVVHQAETLSLAAIAARLETLVAAARAGTLQPADVQGGTFTISNLGMFGIRQFNPIINPPQSAILGVGVIVRQPVAVETAQGEAIAIRPRMAMTLAVDHRVLDGAQAALFLQDLIAALEDPTSFLLVDPSDLEQRR